MRIAPLLRVVSPFGPIFEKELRTTARRKRSYVLRVLYLGALLLFLMMVYAGSSGAYSGTGVAAQNQRMAMLGKEFFFCFSGFSIVSMAFIGPILTCSAIGSERLHKTLPVLLMTPISAWQIVAGKLFSRVLVALTLIGLSLPVLALVRLLGGVELEEMIAVVCVAAATALGTAAIGLFFSTLSNRSYVVILASYSIMFLCYFFVPFVAMSLVFGPRGGAPNVAVFEILSIFNPFFFLIMIVNGGAMMRGGAVWSPWLACVGVQLALATVLLVLSALLVRRMARREGRRRSEPVIAPDQISVTDVDGVVGDKSKRGAGRKANPRRSVGDNPIIWREVRRPLLATRRQGVIGACAAVAVIGISIYAFYRTDDAYRNPYEVHTVYGIFFNVFGWLLAAVLGATAIAQEKESDTWTLLLTTPVSGSAVVWAKALGVLRRLMWPAILLAAYFALFFALGAINLGALILVVWVVVSFNSFWVATGIYLSLRLRKVTTAVILNLLIAVVMYIFVPVTLAMISDFGRAERLARQSCWYLPYYYITIGMEGLSRWDKDPRFPHTMQSLDFSLPFSSRYSVGTGEVSGSDFFRTFIAVGVIHIGLGALLLSYTASRFNKIVSRAPQLVPRPEGYRLRIQAPVTSSDG